MIMYPPSICLMKMLSIMDWKVAGELQRPKNMHLMTSGSKSLCFVLNAAFHSSPFLIQMLLYPQWTSSL
ncbi:hypothetical protein BJ165DRAFT_1308931, partial [Panaeolus papilionaceus]